MHKIIAYVDSLLFPVNEVALFFWIMCFYAGLAMLAVCACTAYNRARSSRRNGQKLRARLAREDDLALASRLQRLTR